MEVNRDHGMEAHYQTWRQCLPLNGGWEFARSKVTAAWCRGRGGGDPVQLPHTWNAEDTFVPGVTYFRGAGRYRVRVDLPEAAGSEVQDDGRWRLRSDGFYGKGTLWIDGRRHGGFDAEYMGLDSDVTDAVAAGGSHWLGLGLSNRHSRHVLPGIRLPDFILYGGLATQVWLERTPRVCLPPGEVRFEVEGVLTSHALVRCEALVSGATDPEAAGLVCECRVLDADGRPVAETVRLSRGTGGRDAPGAFTVRGVIDMGTVRRWQPQDPYRYALEIALLRDGETLDRHRFRFGCREAVFSKGGGFYLNGERLELRGVNRHACIPGLGQALTPELHWQDAALIRSMGLNFVRLSHYPQHPAFLDACDALGILVYAELASWKRVAGGRWLAAAERQFERLIKRDRNRPSVILWGMGNEARQCRAYQRLYALAKRLDPGRAVTYAENHLYRARRKGTLGLPDVWGMNYEFDALDDARSASRTGTTVVTECSNYPAAARSDLREQRAQVALMAGDLARMRDREEVAGFALWCFNDYATLRKQRYRRFCGVVDAWRTPKMSAWYLRALFLEAPVLKLFSDRRAVTPGGEWEVDVVSNCDHVRLWADAHEVSMPGVARHCTVAVPAGTRVLRAAGVGTWGPCEDQLSLGAAAASVTIALDSKPGAGSEVLATAGSVVRYSGEVLDASGQKVSDWHGRVRVRCDGAATVCHHSPDGKGDVAAGDFAGYVRLGVSPGEVILQVEVEGLASGDHRSRPRSRA